MSVPGAVDYKESRQCVPSDIGPRENPGEAALSYADLGGPSSGGHSQAPDDVFTPAICTDLDGPSSGGHSHGLDDVITPAISTDLGGPAGHGPSEVIGTGFMTNQETASVTEFLNLLESSGLSDDTYISVSKGTLKQLLQSGKDNALICCVS